MPYVDLSQPIIYNGHTSQPLTVVPGGQVQTGTRIVSVDFGQVPVSVTQNKRAQRDGSDLSDAYLAGRPIGVIGEIYGSSPGDTADRLEAWLAAYSPSSPTLVDSAAFKFTQPTVVSGTWATGKIPLYLTGSPVREPWHQPLKLQDAVAGGHNLQVFAQLMAADPFAYIDGALISQTLTTASTAIAYRGCAPAWPELWMYLNATGPSSVTVTLGSSGVGYSLLSLDLSGLTTGQIHVLSFDEGRVTYGGVVETGVIGAGSIFGRIVPGISGSYVVNTGTAANITYLKLVYPEAFF